MNRPPPTSCTWFWAICTFFKDNKTINASEWSIINTPVRFYLILRSERFRFGVAVVLDMSLNRSVISVNEGLWEGSWVQQSSISFLHSASQRSGMGGLRVLFTIPPARMSRMSHSKLKAIRGRKIYELWSLVFGDLQSQQQLCRF